jgi:hypothetical protein
MFLLDILQAPIDVSTPAEESFTRLVEEYAISRHRIAASVSVCTLVNVIKLDRNQREP